LLSWLAGAFLAVTAGAFLAGCGTSGYYNDYGYPGYYDYGYPGYYYDYDDGPYGYGGGVFLDGYGRFDHDEHGEHWGGHGGNWSSGRGGGSSGHGGRR
jgi:hypothetical protein